MRGVVPIFRRWWLMILLTALVAGGTALIASASGASKYQAQARLIVGPVHSDVNTFQGSAKLAQTWAGLATSRQVLQATIRRLRVNLSVGRLARSTSATANGITPLLTIRVSDRNPARAVVLANAIGGTLVDLRLGGNATSTGLLRIVAPATDARRVGTTPLLVVPAAGIAGLLCASILALFIDVFRRKIRDAQDLDEVAHLPFLGSVGDGLSVRGTRAPALNGGPISPLLPGYRRLAARVQFSSGDRPARSVLVMGCDGRESATLVAVNLAAVWADEGSDVVAIDVTRHQEPIAHQHATNGEQTQAPADEDHGLDTPRVSRLSFLPLPIRESASGSGLDLLERLRAESKLVVFPAGPEDSAALAWARVADAAVVVAQRGRTKREDVARVVRTLKFVHARLIGVVLLQGRAGSSSGAVVARNEGGQS